MKTVVVIPALNEAQNMMAAVSGVRETGLVDHVIVVDGGSGDATVERAQSASAEVVVELRRGYGRACLAGADQALKCGAEIIAFIDAAGASDPVDLAKVVEPIASGMADLVVGSRTLGRAERGALRPIQKAGNQLATWIIWLRYGHRYTDLGSMRAIRSTSLRRLAMRELGSGWPVEMQVKALRHGLRVHEIPMAYRRRRNGRSKVSGTVKGSVRAGVDILRVVLGASS